MTAASIFLDNLLKTLSPQDPDTGLTVVVVDTPQGSRNKYKFDEQSCCFRLSRTLPAGFVFPGDFGSIPRTLAEDGDALDVLVLTETPSFSGCVMNVRLIGVIEAEQSSKGKKIRNDRLIAVPETKVNKPKLESLADVDAGVVDGIEHFLAGYNLAQGRRFTALRRAGPSRARKLVKMAIKRFEAGDI